MAKKSKSHLEFLKIFKLNFTKVGENCIRRRKSASKAKRFRISPYRRGDSVSLRRTGKATSCGSGLRLPEFQRHRLYQPLREENGQRLRFDPFLRRRCAAIRETMRRSLAQQANFFHRNEENREEGTKSLYQDCDESRG